MGEETLLKTLEVHNQQHIIDHYEKLTSEKQRQFLDNAAPDKSGYCF